MLIRSLQLGLAVSFPGVLVVSRLHVVTVVNTVENRISSGNARFFPWFHSGVSLFSHVAALSGHAVLPSTDGRHLFGEGY